jgi:murein DD-endopeptidase MepM/ murein hydrolase activator NlpD
MSIDKNFVIFASTIYGEACGQSTASWKAIANVIMNRVGIREWKKYSTPAEVAKYSGFDACTQRTPNYKHAENQINAVNAIDEIKDGLVKKLAIAVLPIYENREEDFTNGCQLYYSPKAQKALHEKNPAAYTSIKPKWAKSELLEQIVVPGTEKDDFAWYRYKKKAKVSIKLVDQINRPIKKGNVILEYGDKVIKCITDTKGVAKDFLVSLPSIENIKDNAKKITLKVLDAKNNKIFEMGEIEIKKTAHYMLTLVSPEVRIKTNTLVHKGHKQIKKSNTSIKKINSNAGDLEIKNKRSENGHPLAVVETAVTKKIEDVIEGLLYPVDIPEKDKIFGAKVFGGRRDGGKRLHAGVDIYAPIGTKIRAMADGTVIKSYGFYGETDAIEIDHGSFIALYGEVDPDNIFVKEKQKVKRGETLAKVGSLILYNKKLKRKAPFEHSMLHLEMYGTTTPPYGKNKLTNKSSESKFQRRSDLIDPTEFIKKSTLK